MSKQNTLFSYFKSPASNKQPVASLEEKAPSKKKLKKSEEKSSNKTTPSNKKTKRSEPKGDEQIENDSAVSNREEKSPVRKRRRIVVFDSEDSEDEYKPVPAEAESEGSESEGSSVVSDQLSESDKNSDSEDETPKKKSTKNNSPKTPRTPKLSANVSQFKMSSSSPTSVSPATIAKLAGCSAKSSQGEAKQSKDDAFSDSWSHLKNEFLKPDKIKDAHRRKRDDPDYDPKTLYIPDDFKKNSTPAMRQWWEMKSRHYDCVLFFKVGKFYELYHMDAVIGVNELGLSFMKGEFAHSGFPEIAYGRFSSSLVRKGYKVARVEQTETPDMMAERCKATGKNSKYDKVVNREICQITTKGTQTFSVIDGAPSDTETNYLLALTEKANNNSSTMYGVCFVDTSIGVFHLGQFLDDRHSSCLRTMLAHHPPVQILYEKSTISANTLRLLNSSFGTVLKDPLASNTEFWNAETTLKNLAEGHFFGEKSAANCWPEGLKQFLLDGDSLCLTANDDSELAISALGACIWYLKDCKLDQQILSMGKFKLYRPIDSQEHKAPEVAEILGKFMILDSVTLNNLDILYYGNEKKEGTLLHKLDHTSTPFGKRLLRQWVCSPLCEHSGIVARQEAIKDLQQNPHLTETAREVLGTLPDLERLLSKIHTQGNALLTKDHPNARAIFYEDHIYSKKRIQDFTSTLNGFKRAKKVAELFQAEESCLASSLLVECVCIAGRSTKGRFPDITATLDFFDTAFNHDEALKEGRIIPKSGVDPEYDAILETLAGVQKRLDVYLESQKRFFGCKVAYVGSDKKRFQLEVAEGPAKRVNSSYELQGQRKGYKRYYTSEARELLASQIAAEEQKTKVLKDLSRRIFQQFSSKHEEWNAVINCLSVLDVLISMTEYSRKEEGQTCIPEFVAVCKDKAFVNIRDGRHPCISSVDSFVPNDTVIGCDGTEASLLLLTGPNMGGKSTLMRQLGLIVIMAHMGCHVPASACTLSPVDRIFTRIGANDDIMAGESTFFVELSEASAILHHATLHSLVLVDELGRGTSTYDGTAIAAAVAHALATISCRTLFSTHYHTLVEDFKDSRQVALGHMACMVENDNEEDPSEETVTFLYKFVGGACPKSYGFNAARLAGIPTHIIKKGHDKAKELEKESTKRKLFQSLCGKGDSVDLPKLLSQTLVLV